MNAPNEFGFRGLREESADGNFRVYDGDDMLIAWKLEAHEVNGDHKFYIESVGSPVLSAEQIARLNQAVQVASS